MTLDSPSPLLPGVMASPLRPELRLHLAVPDEIGLLVREVKPGTDAAKAGLKQYDVVLEVAGQRCPGTVVPATALITAPKTRTIDLLVRRGADRVEIKGIPVGE